VIHAITLLLIYVSSLSVLIPLGVFARFRNHLALPVFKLLGVALALSFTFDLSAYISIKLGYSSLPLTNLYTVAECTIYSLIFMQLLPKEDAKLFMHLIAFSVFFLVDTLFIEDLFEFQTNVLIVQSVMMIAYSIMYFSILFGNLSIQLITRFGFFWLNAAIFFYFGFDFFLFVFKSYADANTSQEVSSILWAFHNFNSIIKNIMFAVALGMLGRDRLPKKSSHMTCRTKIRDYREISVFEVNE
jgi:hypothetical protein